MAFFKSLKKKDKDPSQHMSSTPSPSQTSEKSPPTQAPAHMPSGSSSYPWSSKRILNAIDPPTNGTFERAPFPRYGHATNASSNKDGDIYIFGGLVKELARNDLWVIENGALQASPVSTSGDSPSPRVGHAALLIGNAFIVFGGDTKLNDDPKTTNVNNDDALYLLNTSTKIWSIAKVAGAKPSGRYGHTLNMLGPKVLVFGGQVEGFFFNDLVAFDLNTLNYAAPRWELINPANMTEPPPARTNHIAVTHAEKLYVFGGTNGIDWYNDMWRFDPLSRKWDELTVSGFIPQPREGHSVSLVGDVIYIFGGRDIDGNDLGDLAAFKISTSRWFTFQNMGPGPSPRSGHALCTVGKKIFVVGGEGIQTGRGDESMAYILDTTKIRYPVDPRSTSSAGSHQSASLGHGRDASTSTSYNNGLDHSPTPVAGRQRRNSKGKEVLAIGSSSTNSSSGLPQPRRIMQSQSSVGPSKQYQSRDISASPGSLNGQRVASRESQISSRRGSALQGSAKQQANGKSPFASQSRQSSYQRNVSEGNDTMAARRGQQYSDSMIPQRRSSLDSLLDVDSDRGQSSRTSQRGLSKVRSLETFKGQDGEQNVESGQKISGIDATIAQDKSLHEEISIDSAQYLSPPLRTTNSGNIQTILSNSVALEKSEVSSIANGNSEPNPVNHSNNEENANTSQCVVATTSIPIDNQEISARSTQLKADDSQMQREIQWLRLELQIAKRNGYALNDDSVELQEQNEIDGNTTRALVAMRQQLIAAKELFGESQAKLQEEIASLTAERDAAIQEAHYSKSRHAAFMSSDAEMFDSVEARRVNDLETRLAESFQSQNQLSQEVTKLTNEVSSAKEIKIQYDDLLSDHVRTIEEARLKHAELLEEHQHLRIALNESQRTTQDHNAKRIESEALLSKNKIDENKLQVLEEKYAQQVAIMDNATKVITLSTERADHAEAQLGLEKEKNKDLTTRINNLTLEITQLREDMASYTNQKHELEKSLAASKEEAASGRATILSGLADVIRNFKDSGPYDSALSGTELN